MCIGKFYKVAGNKLENLILGGDGSDNFWMAIQEAALFHPLDFCYRNLLVEGIL